jgi:hypothetical protein
VVAIHGHAGAFLTEADQLGVRSSSRREALGGDVETLEQIRLAGAVGPDGKDDPRLEIELEGRIGAVVPERERPDDQPWS